MTLKHWKLKDAKNRFNKLVELAIKDGPQIIEHGKQSFVILSYERYQQLINPKKNLVSFFQESPLYGLDLDFDRTKDNSNNSFNLTN